MKTVHLVCLFLLASIAAAQSQQSQMNANAGQMGYPTPMPSEAFYRQQRASLMDTKRNLISMINELRDTIFKQQMILNQYYRNQNVAQQQN